jgi:hypothetical protein
MVNHLKKHNIMAEPDSGDDEVVIEEQADEHSLGSRQKATLNTKTSAVSKFTCERNSMARFVGKQRTREEWYTRMAVENGMSFNMMASSEFIRLAFTNMGMQPKLSRSWVSDCVNGYIIKLQKETKSRLEKDFADGKRFSVVIDEWTSISMHRFLNVCIITSTDCTNLGLARCHGSMTAPRTVELLKVCNENSPLC